MAISPDGSTLALLAHFGDFKTAVDRRILIVPSKGGEPKEIVRPKEPPRDPIFSRDGRHLIWSTQPPDGTLSSELFSIPVEGGQPQPFHMTLAAIDFPSFSPDGAHLYFQSAGSRRQGLWSLKIQAR
jgi:Tol biopolymer transport system component